MEIATIIYERYLVSRGVSRKAWGFARKLLIRLLRDPICSMSIHGRHLKLPLSHALPIYLRNHPFYDRLPQRISEYIHLKQGRLCGIDVGANIGDTIAAFYKSDSDTFLAIEPNPKFCKLLSANWGRNANITVVSEVCSSASGETTLAIHEKAGTASLVQTENGITMTRRSLDEIVDDHSFAKDANLLKIDTDGHDFEVIAGSSRVLSRNLPVLLFECDASGNPTYSEDCIKTLRFLNQIGYDHFLLYNNFGNLMGKYSLSELKPFRNLLFYQLTSDFYYFDILVMKCEDISQFYAEEINYFADKMPNKSLQRTAIAAATLAEADIGGNGKVIGFLCGGCGYPAGDSASRTVQEGGDTYPASFMPVRIPCGRSLDTLYVLEAFKEGFDGVVVFRCREGHCHNLIGNLDMDRRINLLRTVLRSRNIDDGRLRIIDISPFEGERFVEQVNDVYASLASIANGKGGPQ